MPQDTAPAPDPNLTTRTPGNPDMLRQRTSPRTLRRRTAGIRLHRHLSMVATSLATHNTNIPPAFRWTRIPTMQLAPTWWRRSRNTTVRRTLTRTETLLEATLPLPTDLQARHITPLLPKEHTLRSRNPWMPLLGANRMDPPARPKSWALPPAKPQCTTASMSPSPSTRIRLPLLPAQLRLPVHRLKRDTVEVHIHAAATANGTVTTDLVADREPRR